MLSSADTDLSMQFLAWRSFGFGELARGHLALWNPHVFSGTPFFGAFESALLYPPNWLHLVLPLAAAVNAIVILHVFLAGAFTFFWARGRGASPQASALAGAVFMFSGPFFLRVYAGHMPPLCVMVWAPALFCAIDGWNESGSGSYLLAGMFAVCMQVLAGNPQYAYYTALFAGLYALTRGREMRTLAGVSLMYMGGAALSAVQLLTGLQAAAESVRAGGIAYGFAATFSLPFENLPTLIAPRMLGGLSGFPYFGQWYYWETVPFVGAAAALLACVAAFERKNRAVAALALLALLMALGAHTPLFGLLYRFLPGFGLFRGAAKLDFLTALFVSLLAARGFERLRDEKPAFKTAAAAGAAGLGLAAAGLVLARHRTGAERFMGALGAIHSIHLPERFYHDPAFVRAAAAEAGLRLALCGGVLGLAALCAGLMAYSRKAVYGLAALVVIESVFFARSNLATMKMDISYPAAWMRALEGRGDSRVLHDAQSFPNVAMKLGASDAWGYGSFVLKRYAQFMAFSQGVAPDVATQYLTFKKFPPIFSILRCRYAFIPDEKETVLTLPRPLSHVELVDGSRVMAGRDDILKALFAAGFDPRKEVILEQEPVVSPQKGPGAAGKASVTAETTDSLDIEAEVSRPSILLITDPYSRGWRALSLGPSPQERYEVLPADYVLRAVPLAAGRHRIRLEYAPSGFRVGKWVSGLSLLAFIAAAGWAWRKSAASRIISI